MLNRLLVTVVACASADVVWQSNTACARSPASPVIGQLVEPRRLRGVENVLLDGEYAYLPCREGRRLTVGSISDPTAPTITSSFTHEELDHAAGCAIDGNTIYLALKNQLDRN